MWSYVQKQNIPLFSEHGVDWTMLLTNWVHWQTQFILYLVVDWSCRKADVTWSRGHRPNINLAAAFSSRAAAGWHISTSRQGCCYSSPMYWRWMRGQVVSTLVVWRIYVVLWDAVVVGSQLLVSLLTCCWSVNSASVSTPRSCTAVDDLILSSVTVPYRVSTAPLHKLCVLVKYVWDHPLLRSSSTGCVNLPAVSKSSRQCFTFCGPAPQCHLLSTTVRSHWKMWKWSGGGWKFIFLMSVSIVDLYSV